MSLDQNTDLPPIERLHKVILLPSISLIGLLDNSLPKFPEMLVQQERPLVKREIGFLWVSLPVRVVQLQKLILEESSPDRILKSS